MNNDEQIRKLEQLVNGLLAGEEGLFLVSIRIKPTNNIRVYVDGDQGVGIGRLATINRSLYKKMEEEGMYPDGNFSLEVSSPGLEEPLKLHRQYLKNIGRKVEVTLLDDAKIEGRLLSADQIGIVVEEEKGKGKKKELIQHNILFPDIKTTKIQISF
ncbi:MAG: ribosome maturation factor [Terrimonas sp.]|nr:ribosome maturation factor [Terrimonas sp.]